jgi:hypothetical protein
MYPNFCMLYYLENAELTECMTCGHSRYKPRTGRGKNLVAYKKLRYFLITPRLQRLFMSPRTAEHMTWHKSHHAVDGVMVHPFDGKAWKHFNSVHPHFSAKSRNVRLGLCTDGFNPFESFAAPYSCWPVILTVYNLPPRMCMRPEFMFLSMVIPGPSSPGRNIDVCLRPLIDKLTQLWSSGALTYDISRKQNFVMRAALMWTINDFLAYGMVSGWSTHGKLACPYSMENNKAFTLTNRGKAFFFTVTVVSCHRITGTERTKKISLLVELKRILHPHVFLVKNCMMLCQSTVLCLVSNQVSISFLVLV